VAVHDPKPPVPGDLPEYRGDPPPSAFTLPERADWVPQAVRPRPAPTPDDVEGPDATPVGLRLRRWHLVAAGLVVVLALTGIGVIAAGYEPVGRAEALPTTSPTSPRPAWRPPTLVARPSVTLVPRIPPPSFLPGQPKLPALPGVPGVPGVPGLPSRPSTPAPTVTPRLVPTSPTAVTPVPTGARSVRVEAWGEPGATIEVGVTDSRLTRYVLPSRRGPLAFDVALPASVLPADYVIVRVRALSVAGGTSRGEVACRVLVGGVLLRVQQSRGYATCQLSPYYDVRRR